MIKFENAPPAAPTSSLDKAAPANKLATETRATETGAGETGVSETAARKKRGAPAAKPAKDAKAPQSDLLDL